MHTSRKESASTNSDTDNNMTGNTAALQQLLLLLLCVCVFEIQASFSLLDIFLHGAIDVHVAVGMVLHIISAHDWK